MKLTWTDSVQFCNTKLGSHLIEIHDFLQQYFIRENAKEEDTKNRNYWIGLTDEGENEGVYRWAHSKKIATYFYWGQGRPSGHYNPGRLLLYYPWDYHWIDWKNSDSTDSEKSNYPLCQLN